MVAPSEKTRLVAQQSTTSDSLSQVRYPIQVLSYHCKLLSVLCEVGTLGRLVQIQILRRPAPALTDSL